MDGMKRKRIAVGIAEILRMRDTFTDPILIANITTPIMENIIGEVTDELDTDVLSEVNPSRSGEEILKQAIELARKLA